MLPAIRTTHVFARAPDPEDLHTAHRIRHPVEHEWFVSECPSRNSHGYTFLRKSVHVFDQLIKSKRSVPPESTLLFQLSQQQHNMKFGSVAFLVVNSAAILHRGSAMETSVAEPDSWADVSTGLNIAEVGNDGGDSFDYDGSFEVRILY